MGMTPDECFEFDYLMQIDQESREAAAREDSARDSGVSRDYGSSGGFYGSRKSTKNSSLKTNLGGIIFLVIIAILVIVYNIDKAHQEKRREEWRAKMAEIKAQELLESEANSGYEEIPTLDQEIVLNPEEIEEPKQEANPEKSPYDGCSYVGEDNQWHPCPKQSVTVKEDADTYVPVAQIPVAQIPEAHIPEAHIPTATIPTSTNSNTQSWRDTQETYYNEINGQYYNDYDEYDASLEEFQRRGYNSYDEYFEDYFYSNREDLYNDYFDDWGGYNDDGQVYDYADLYYDFRDDHYGEYF